MRDETYYSTKFYSMFSTHTAEEISSKECEPSINHFKVLKEVFATKVGLQFQSFRIYMKNMPNLEEIHCDSRKRKRSHDRSPLSGKKQRRYRGSSGTRTIRRSYDRTERLKHYYQKKYENDQTAYNEKNGSIKVRSKKNNGGSIRDLERKDSQSSTYSSKYKSDSSCGRYSRQADSPHYIENDEDGHLIYRAGDMLKNRYEMDRMLGRGTFGKCIKCYDRKSNGDVVAVKIIRNVEKYRDAAKLEIRVLRKIAKKDTLNESLCIELLGYFDYHGHTCLVFPKLGKSVYDFMKSNHYQPYPFNHVKHIAFQLLTAVRFLHKLGLTHTDLKPENMLFMDSSYDSYYCKKTGKEYRQLKNPDIKLIDFGSATFDHEHHCKVVSTRHYRAPEVVLELGWSHPCDLWSCGCIIFEIYTGNTLFQTHSNHEHLAMMEETLGPIPSKMIRETSKTYFHNGRLDWSYDYFEGYVEENCKPLKRHRRSDSDRHLLLINLLKNLLRFEPEKRLTAKEALRHMLFDDMQKS